MTGIVYFNFTASTLSAIKAFNPEALWTLQLLMFTGAMIALTVVTRALQGFTGRDDGCPELPALPRVSVGLAHLPAGVTASLEEIYLKADNALYAAKDHASRWIVEVEFRRQNPA